MSHRIQNRNQFKSFSEENFTGVKEREFAMKAEVGVPVRTRSDWEVAKESLTKDNTMENSSYGNLAESFLLDSAELRLNHPHLFTPELSEEKNNMRVLLPSNVDSSRKPGSGAAESVKGKIHSNERREDNITAISSLGDKCTNLSADVENNVISRPMILRKVKLSNEELRSKSCKDDAMVMDTNETSLTGPPREANDNVSLSFDHYKQSDTKKLIEFELNSVKEMHKFSKCKESTAVMIPNIETCTVHTSLQENMDPASDEISMDGTVVNSSEKYLDDPPYLTDTSPAVNRCQQLPLFNEHDTLSNHAVNTILKPLALHQQPSRKGDIAELVDSNTVQKAHNSHSNDDNPPPKPTKYDDDDVDLIQLSSSSSLAHEESHTPPAKSNGFQMTGLKDPEDCTLPTYTEFLEWPFLHPIKETIEKEGNFRFGKDKVEPAECIQGEIDRQETTPKGFSPTTVGKSTHLSNHTKNGTDIDIRQLLSHPVKATETPDDSEVERQLSADDQTNKTNFVSDTEFGQQMNDRNPVKISADLQSCEAWTPTLNSGIDHDLIMFFTQDAVSSSPSSLSRETNEEADREVADIMAQESDDYIIEFKSESSSNDWTVSSANSNEEDLNMLKLKQCEGMLAEDGLDQVAPSTSPDLLLDHPPKEFPVEGRNGDRSITAPLDQRNSSITSDSPFPIKPQEPVELVTQQCMPRDESTPGRISEGEKKTLNENSRVSGNTGVLKGDQKLLNRRQNITDDIDDLSKTEVCFESTHRRAPPSENNLPKDGQTEKSPVLIVSSETLLQMLPNVPDFLPSDEILVTGDKMISDPPQMVRDTGLSLNDSGMMEQSYPGTDIYAKTRMRAAGGVHRSEMNGVLSELSREHAECQRLSRDFRRAREEYLQVKRAVDELVAKITNGSLGY